MIKSLKDNRPLVALFLPVVLFYAGWGKFLLAGDAIYFADYVLRLALIGLVLAIWGWGMVADRPAASAKALLLTVLALYLLSGVEYLGDGLNSIGITPPVSLFPPITSEGLRYFDLSIGIALVALSEELVFRGAFVKCAKKLHWSEGMLYLTSVMSFGILHSHQGLSGIILTALSGTILMALYRLTGTLWAPIMAHYLLDVIIFSGFGCQLGMGGCGF